jgi:uncharacterized protein
LIVACAAPAQNEAVPAVRPALPVTTSQGIETGDVDGFAVESVLLGDRSLLVAIADTPDLRSVGLMRVRDMGDLDGMVFVFDAEVAVNFTMRNTLIPLDIAFFDAAGTAVDRFEMVPCQAEPCPEYGAASEFRYALEMPAGTMGELNAGEVLIVG